MEIFTNVFPKRTVERSLSGLARMGNLGVSFFLVMDGSERTAVSEDEKYAERERRKRMKSNSRNHISLGSLFG
jgi:hypothetical protein